MKRIFKINGLHEKDAPKELSETPQLNSKVSYNSHLYTVTEVVYYMAIGEIHIYLTY